MKNKKITLVLALVIGLGPFSVDLYLPAFPTLKAVFGSSFSLVQLTLSSYLVGFALFHLICGPLSDRYGRKPILLSGLLLYSFISFACAMATNIETLILLRFLQGVCVCVAPVLSRAIIRDLYAGDTLVKNLATLSAFMALAPIVAPLLGSLILQFGPWQWHFYCLGFLGLLCCLMVLIFVEETLPRSQPFKLKVVFSNIMILASDKRYIFNILFNSLIYAPLFAFLSVSGFILIDHFNLTTLQFGMYFTGMVFGFMVGSFYMLKRGYQQKWYKLFVTASNTTLASGAIMCVLFYVWQHPLAVILPMFLATFSIGIVLPKSMGLALENYPNMAGTASALMGFLQMLVASLVGAIAGATLISGALPLAIIIVSCALCSFILLRKLTDLQKVVIRV